MQEAQNPGPPFDDFDNPAADGGDWESEGYRVKIYAGNTFAQEITIQEAIS